MFCKAKPNWTASKFIDDQIKNIQNIVGHQKVICALSGGVDSTVVAVLLKKAIGNNAVCVFVDHGLLRKNEANDVMNMYTKSLDLNVNLLDKSDEFLTALNNVKGPEKKSVKGLVPFFKSTLCKVFADLKPI